MGGITDGFDIANDWLEQQINAMINQMNQLIEKHKPFSDAAKQLAEDLKKLDLASVGQALTNMNSGISLNLKTIIEDQKSKYDMITTVDSIDTIDLIEPTVIDKILNILEIFFTACTIIEMIMAPSMAGIAMEGLFLILDTILGFLGFLQNLQVLDDVANKQKELERYFAPGGQYEQDMKKVGDVTFQMIENFYMFTIGARGLIYELTININLLSISSSSQKLNYKKYIDQLKRNPFDAEFQKECRAAYDKFISIKNEPFETRVMSSYKFLEEFETKTNFVQKLGVIAQICSNFQKDSELGKELERVSADRTKLAQQRDKYKPRFQKRKNVKPEDLPKQDADIFQDMVDTFDKLDEPEISVVQVVSFFTTEFFADDPTGKTLRGHDLKEIFEKTESLNYIGANTSGQNIIYLPKPENPDLIKWWDYTQNRLSDGYKASKPGVEFTVKKMYMRMICETFIANNQEKSRLNFYYGILIKPKSSQLDQFYEEEASKVTEHPSTTRSIPSKIEEYEIQGESLRQVCAEMTLHINLIAYPERVIKFSVFKKDNKYKGVLVWDSKTIKPELFGKILKCKLYNLTEVKEKIESKGPVFYEQVFEEEQSLVSMTFK